MHKENDNSLKNRTELIVEELRLLHEIEPGLIFCTVVLGTVRALSPFINIYMTAKITNEILDDKNYLILINYAVITVLLNFIVNILHQALTRLKEVKNSSFYFKLKLKLSSWSHLVSFQDFENSKTREDFQKVYDSLSHGYLSSLNSYLADLVGNIVSLIIAILLSYNLFAPVTRLDVINGSNYFYSLFFSIAFIVIFTVAMVLLVLFNVRHDRELIVVNQKRSVFNKVCSFYEKEYIEDINTGKEIRLYNQSPLIINEIKNEYDKMTAMEHVKCRSDIKYNLSYTLISELMSSFVYFLVVVKCIYGLVSLGNVIQYTAAINKLVVGTCKIVSLLVHIKENNKYMCALKDFLVCMKSKNDVGIDITNLDLDNLTIQFHNVSFKYPNDSKYALKNFSAIIRPKEKIAIVGTNGSGKTTLIKLLCKLYRADSGYITINGINIDDFSDKNYWKLFSVMFQDSKLLGFSIAENIAVSCTFDKNKVLELTNNIGLNINDFALGIDTKVNKDFYDDGIELSGGESQRVLIARGLHKNAPIIIMDEPTSALDPLVESDLHKKVRIFAENRTSIFISHRLSLCKFCDRIFVIDNGTLVQEGSHRDLVTINGKYRNLWNAQSQYYL